MSESRRIEFSELTKKILAGSAGHMCSFTDCPQTTIGPELKEDGSAGVKRYAVAAHINAASPQGPRPPGSMSEDEIRSEENGVWMCPSCAELVDKFQFQYPAAMLLEMKRIRVTAQRLAMHDKTIAFMAHWIGVMRLDRIVRDHLPDLDTARIRKAVTKAFVTLENAFAESDPLPVPPFPLAILPALNQAVSHATAAGVQNRNDRGSGWKELIDIWRVQFDPFPDEPQRAIRFQKGYARIYARDPVSGKLSPESVEANTNAMLIDDNTDPLNRHQTIHLRNTFSNTSSLEWELNVKPAGDSFEVNSSLTMWMSVMRRPDSSKAARREFESYASVLTKIARGWQPVGFVGVTFPERTLDREYHPTPVSIVSKIKPEQLEQGLRRNERVRVGYKLADQFEITPRFTEVWFSDLVTDQVLLEGATTFLTGLGPRPWPKSASTALLQIDHRRQLVLSVIQYTLFATVQMGASERLNTQM